MALVVAVSQAGSLSFPGAHALLGRDSEVCVDAGRKLGL